ncbi:MAG: hypothetical protein ACK5PG_14600 [Lysobacterales bacterium]
MLTDYAGCIRPGPYTYEAAHRGYMAIDLAPEVSLEAVRQYLIEQGAHWELADPTYEDLYPEAR